MTDRDHEFQVICSAPTCDNRWYLRLDRRTERTEMFTTRCPRCKSRAVVRWEEDRLD
jgi:hypothetical protein